MKDDLDELMNWLNSSALMSDLVWWFGFASLAILPLNAKVLLS
jgi:hypothetical protein